MFCLLYHYINIVFSTLHRALKLESFVHTLYIILFILARDLLYSAYVQH